MVGMGAVVVVAGLVVVAWVAWEGGEEVWEGQGRGARAVVQVMVAGGFLVVTEMAVAAEEAWVVGAVGGVKEEA